MALRIGQQGASGYPAVLPEEEEVPMEAPVEEAPIEEPMDMGPGSVAEWIQEALDICQQAQCPEELAFALEQALTLLIGPSAVGATEPMVSPEIPEESFDEDSLDDDDDEE